MLNLFKKNQKIASDNPDFGYLQPNECYFDSTCQTLRPQSIIDTEVDYYHNFNSCGHRVKYKWGEKTDNIVTECRENLLKMVQKNDREYTVAFTLNTTFGINQVIFQLPQKFKNIYTSDIEHNSVFIPSIEFARVRNGKREVLAREEGGSLTLPDSLNQNPVLLVNTTSNIDGRHLINANKLAEQIHANQGLVLLDACQSFTHNLELLQQTDFDACFGSGHKMYGPSIGFIIIKKDLVKNLDSFWLGGSTVQKVGLNNFELIDNDDEIYARLEPGLQSYAGIVGLNEAIKWLPKYTKSQTENLQNNPESQKLQTNTEFQSKLNEFKTDKAKINYEDFLSVYLNYKLAQIPNITLLNPNPSPIVSLYSDKIDSHKLGAILGEFNIMCRVGYHCCHYYLLEKMKFPPLLRISLGLHNTPEQIDFLVEKLKSVVSSF